MDRKLIAVPIFVAAALILSAVNVGAASHTVSAGDTLSGIAAQKGTTVETIASINPQIKDVNSISIGDIVTVSGSAESLSDYQGETVVSNESATTYETYLLAQLIHAEANNQPYIGKVAVGNVVINRKQDSRFPNDLVAVIQQSGQFDPVANGSIFNTPTPEDIQAAQDAQGVDFSGGAVYFYNSALAGDSWWDSLETTGVIGDHTFKR